MDSYIMDALNEVLQWDLPDEVIGEAVLLAVEGRIGQEPVLSIL